MFRNSIYILEEKNFSKFYKSVTLEISEFWIFCFGSAGLSVYYQNTKLAKIPGICGFSKSLITSMKIQNLPKFQRFVNWKIQITDTGVLGNLDFGFDPGIPWILKIQNWPKLWDFVDLANPDHRQR